MWLLGALASLLFASLVAAQSECSKACEHRYGYAYEFLYGTYGIIDHNTAVQWFNYDSFTYQFWMKPYSVFSDIRQGIIGALLEMPTRSQYYNAGVYIIGDSLYLLAGQHFHTNKNVKYSLAEHNYKWLHVTATFDRNDAGGTSKLYINGNLVSQESNQGPCTSVIMPIYLASSTDSEYYRGQLDEIRAFDYPMTEDEVNETWSEILTGDEDGLYFYFTADGDQLRTLKDHSKNGRDTALIRSDAASGANNRIYFRADCVGCFNITQSGMPGYCLPNNEEVIGTCGDGLVLGEEQCDSGEGCLPNCSCAQGYMPRNLPYCIKRYNDAPTVACNWTGSLNDCLPALYPKCNCSCMNATGLHCLLHLGCDANDIHTALYVTWLQCLGKCPWSTHLCHQIIPEWCARWNNAGDCAVNNCFWCTDGCTTQEADCPVVCGNGILQSCEICDDGNTANGDGCSNQCTVEPGFNCDAHSICTTRCGDSIMAGNETCDDGNTADNDGCSAGCVLQSGFVCVDTVCNPVCGDGITAGAENCDDGNSAGGDGCSQQCIVEEGYTCTQSQPSICSSNSLSSGAIAGIAIAVIVGAAIITAAIVVPILLMKRKHKGYRSGDNGSGSPSDVVVALDEMGQEEATFDPSTSTFLDTSQFPLKMEPATLTFGLEEGARAQIDAPLAMSLTITNTGSAKLHWKLAPAKDMKYALSFNPAEGSLSRSEGVSISAQLIIRCTTRLQLKVPLVIWEKVEGQELRHTFVPANAESKLSTRLDPDEIKLVQPPIGEGSFGTVFRGVYKTQEVAVKVLKNQRWGLKISEFFREMKIMEELRSPYIVNFIGAVIFPGRMCIVSEFIPHGSLASLIHKEQTSLLLKIRMCLDCARGMAYLHSCKIMHRDLKPDNLLVLSLDEIAPVVCKLTDFGSTREVGEEMSANYTKGVGTPIYMAPEILETEGGYSMGADVYSFAILMWEVFVCKEPFSDMNFHKPWQIADHVIKGGRMAIPESCPEPYAALIKRCWAQDAKERPLFPEIVMVLDDFFVPLANEKYPRAGLKTEKSKSATVAETSLLLIDQEAGGPQKLAATAAAKL